MKKSVRNAAPRQLAGEQWVGLHVRAYTHRILSKAEKARLPSIASVPDGGCCRGKVVRYCPTIDMHFIVFGQRLQPVWTRCNEEGAVELLLDGPDASDETCSVAEVVSASSQGGMIICQLCQGVCSKNIEQVLYCSTCNDAYHQHCLPAEKGLRPLFPDHATLKKPSNSWTCFDCTACHNCGVSCWNSPLIYWNVQRAEKIAPEHWLLLCGVCLRYYKQHKNFCTICFKLYTVDDSALQVCGDEPAKKRRRSKKDDKAERIPNKGFVGEVADSNPVPTATSLSFSLSEVPGHDQQPVCTPEAQGEVSNGTLHESNAMAVAEDFPLGSCEDDRMVQCNECARWIHAECEGLDESQYNAIAARIHPIWVSHEIFIILLLHNLMCIPFYLFNKGRRVSLSYLPSKD
ncbi:hypothetical protein EON64_06510 [archaeon]|nr:MAG: hypothetical protein EON64_06510 [archaeon]